EDHRLSAYHEKSEASQDLAIATLFTEFFQKSYFITATPAVVYPYHVAMKNVILSNALCLAFKANIKQKI
uniref:Uncharacterized protein n=1 Tax=Glossina palpalis gambiensis TaxID=67801 RepID=A0A1B0AKT3_9MUSC